MHVGITAALVRDVYLKAMQRFACRTQRPVPLDVNAIVDAHDAPSSPIENVDEVPLDGLPHELRKRVKMLEALLFAEFLLPDPQHRNVAVKMVLGEWLANPFSLLPPRVLLRRTLPISLVSRIVAFRNKSRRNATIAAS
jgi:hypothetical protein